MALKNTQNIETWFETQLYSFQKLFLIGALLVVGATAQIYTVKGPDGYKYPKPQARINVEDAPQAVS